MKDVILRYFIVLREIFEILATGEEEEVKKQKMVSYKTFMVDFILDEVKKYTSDQHLID